MELVSCQSCGHQLEAASKFCNECGQRRDEPVLTRQTLTGDPPVYDRRSETRARCPGCGGEQFRKLSLIHDGGISHTSSATKGVGVTLGGGIGIGSAKSRGMNVTELARKAAPPEKISLLKAIGAGLFFGFFVAAMLPQGWEYLALLAFLALPIGVGYWVVKYNRETWAPAYAAWQKRFMCDRCGEVFAL